MKASGDLFVDPQFLFVAGRFGHFGYPFGMKNCGEKYITNYHLENEHSYILKIAHYS